MFKSFVISFCVTLATIWASSNIHKYNQSFDNCERLLAEVHQNLAILENEIQTLQQSMGVDYE